MTRRKLKGPPDGLVGEPLDLRTKWRAIVVSTLVLVPSLWAILAGVVAIAADDPETTGGPDPAGALALGFALVPFVFITLAFMSRHPRAPIAVVKAMGMSLLVGLLVSAAAGDAVSGLVAGAGAGGILALRPDRGHRWTVRAAAVALATLYTFVLVRTVGGLVLLAAPVFPFTAVGMADLWVDWRAERQAA